VKQRIEPRIGARYLFPRERLLTKA